jgi:hypothetical protein
MKLAPSFVWGPRCGHVPSREVIHAGAMRPAVWPHVRITQTARVPRRPAAAGGGRREHGDIADATLRVTAFLRPARA